MTAEQYKSMLTKRWPLIIACAILAGLGAFGVTKAMTPIYQATAVVQVVVRSAGNQIDLNSTLTSNQLAQTDVQLVSSDPVLHAVASHYHNLSVGQLAGEVQATARPNTPLFDIIVQDADNRRAANLANDLATTLVAQQSQAEQQANTRMQRQIQQSLDAIQRQMDVLNAKLTNVQKQDEQDARIVSIQAKIAGLKLRYSQLQQALAQMVLNEAQGTDPLRIVRTAQPGKQSLTPNVQLNTQAGLLAGLFLGFILAALWELLDTRVRTADALVQLLQWPILATLWHVDVDDKRDLLNPGPHDLNVESYRILRTNLGFASLDKPLRSLMITSALPEEGKSLVAANLAIFMAKAGKNTLLIDADLRQPMLHRLFDLAPEKQGLSNALLVGTEARAGLFSLDSFVHSVNIPNLRVMPSGPLPPNPSELLDSRALQRFFLALSGCGADVIIFDTPPASALSDASILTSHIDGTVVVVDATCARKDQLKQVKTVLTQAGSTVLGCVLNKQHLTRRDAVYLYTEDSPRPSLISILGLRK